MKLKKVVYYFFLQAIMLISHVHTQEVISNKKQPLKILFVINQFPKFLQQFILNQITGMIDLGHEVHIYANSKYDKNIPEAVLRYNLLEKTTFRKLPSDHPDYDILYCHCGPEGYVGLELKKQYNLTGKVVTCFRGDDISHFLLPKANKKRFKRRGPYQVPCYYPEMYTHLFKKGNLFLPVCDYFKEKLISLGCKPTKIKIGHSAIDCNKFNYKEHKLKPHKSINLISTCRLVEKKGLFYSIQAVASLCKKYPKLHYTIIGDGNQREKLQQVIDDLGVSDKISLVGWMEQNQVLHQLLRSHIFILPAITAKNGDQEGIPNALKEAMACGLPVISTPHAGIPELVLDGISGYLVEEKKVEPIIEKIELLINNPEKIVSMGRAGRHHVEAEFNTATENAKLEALFYRLVNQPSKNNNQHEPDLKI